MIISQQPSLLSSLGNFQIPAGNLASAATLATLLAALSPAAVIPPGSKVVLLQSEAQNIRYTDDGVLAPTATVGFLLFVTQAPVAFSSSQFNLLKLIQATSGGILNVGFYG